MEMLTWDLQRCLAQARIGAARYSLSRYCGYTGVDTPTTILSFLTKYDVRKCHRGDMLKRGAL